jgi:hypothetical protein
MAVYVNSTGEVIHLEDHTDRVRRLLRDLEALGAGAYPTRAEIEDAPVLENWSLATRKVPCLTGTFFGHPKIRSGNFGVTSDIWIHAPSLGYARSLSRLFRLGPAASETEVR